MTNTKSKYTLFILNMCIFISLYFVVYLLFFGLMGIHNPQIISFSRTAAVTLISFTAILVMMHNIYGKINVSREKRNISNLSTMLSILFTDLFAYIILQIMNVNPQNNKVLTLFGVDFKFLILCIFLQFFWIYIVTLLGDRIFYFIFPPLDSVIICDNQEHANEIYSKFQEHKHRILITKVLHFNSPKLMDSIAGKELLILSSLPLEVEKQLTDYCYRNSIDVLLAPSIQKLVISASKRMIFEDKAFLNIDPIKMSFTQQIIKRGMDIILSSIALLLLSPLLVLCAIIIKFYDKGPIFFIQERETINENTFRIIKFRTMLPNIDAKKGKSVSAAIDDDRITKPGKILRKFRIDELPQLLNILKGDMSFVGPRPEMLENAYKYAEEYPEFKYRLKVKGGLTGLAQIDGKYNTSFEDKLLLDLFYIENFSLGLDLKLLFRTLTVFFRKDSTEGFGTSNTIAPPIIY